MRLPPLGTHFKRFTQTIASALLTLLAASILCILLVKFAPGFGSDIRELDPRLNAASVRALRAKRESGALWSTFRLLTARVLTGDLGNSETFQRPVVQVVAERTAVTVIPLLGGIFGGWLLAIAASLLNRMWNPFLRSASRGASSWLLCLPAPVIALALITTSASPQLAPFWVGCAVALVTFPRVLLTTDRVLAEASLAEHVESARNKGISRLRILFAHVVLPSTPALLAIAGSSVGVALGAVMPIEVICDSPGLGQLAWLATQQRDLPVLLTVTFLITVAALSASLLGDLARTYPSHGVRAA